VLDFIYEGLPADNPRRIGRALLDIFEDLWRYKIGDYRVICELQDARLIVLVVRIGERRSVYAKPFG